MRAGVLLSVITVNLNNIEGLRRTLASIVSIKELGEVEFIFVDGGSSDGSVSLAKLFYDVGFLRSEPDSGVYDAMNKSVGMANGKFLYWLNSGDEFLAARALDVLRVLREDDSAVVTFGTINRSGPTSERDEVHRPCERDLPLRTLPHQATFFRKDVLARYGGYRTDLAIVSDRELILRMWFAGEQFKFQREVVSISEGGGLSSTSKTAVENALLDFVYDLSSASDLWCAFRVVSGRMASTIKLVQSLYLKYLDSGYRLARCARNK